MHSHPDSAIEALSELVRLKDEHDAREGREWAGDGKEKERKEVAWANARKALAAAYPQQTEGEKDDWIRAAYDFIERVQTWTGVDPDEIHELLQSVPSDAI